jgi:hypothetical protein
MNAAAFIAGNCRERARAMRPCSAEHETWENGKLYIRGTLDEVLVDSSVQQNFGEIFADEEA